MVRDRHPRTMQEAFGPYTSRRIEDPDARTPAHEWALYGLAVLAALLGAWGWL